MPLISKLIFCCFLLVITLPSQAQQETSPILAQLQADPDILWIGTVEIDYIPKYGNAADSEVNKALLYNYFGVYFNKYKLLKSSHQKEQGLRKRASQLIVKLVDNASDLEAYANAELTQALTAEEVAASLMIRDTFLDVEQFNKRNADTDTLPYYEIEHDPLTAIKAIRTKQLFYYNRKKLAFEVKILAIAPLVVSVDKTSWRLKTKRPAFWLSVENLKTRPDWQQASITWAQQFYTYYPLKKIIVLKATQPLAQVINGSIRAFKQQEQAICIGGPSYQEIDQEILAYNWKELDDVSVDTIITFDPETFEEIIEVKKEKFEGQHIEQLLMIQEFYWDKKTQQVGIYQLGFGYVNRITNQTYFIRLPYKDKLPKE